MITRQNDTARKAYARDAATVPRQFVMIGTTDKLEVLNDVAGNRRYLPITVGAIDLEGLRRDRDQLWAEAAAIEASASMPRLVLPDEVRPDAKAAQQRHEMSNPIFEALEEELGDDGGVIEKDTVYAIVGFDRAKDLDPRKYWLIKNAMIKLGWTESWPRSGTRKRIYTKDTGRQLRFSHKTNFDGTGKPLIIAQPLDQDGEAEQKLTPIAARMVAAAPARPPARRKVQIGRTTRGSSIICPGRPRGSACGPGGPGWSR